MCGSIASTMYELIRLQQVALYVFCSLCIPTTPETPPESWRVNSVVKWGIMSCQAGRGLRAVGSFAQDCGIQQPTASAGLFQHYPLEYLGADAHRAANPVPLSGARWPFPGSQDPLRLHMRGGGGKASAARRVSAAAMAEAAARAEARAPRRASDPFPDKRRKSEERERRRNRADRKRRTSFPFVSGGLLRQQRRPRVSLSTMPDPALETVLPMHEDMVGKRPKDLRRKRRLQRPRLRLPTPRSSQEILRKVNATWQQLRPSLLRAARAGGGGSGNAARAHESGAAGGAQRVRDLLSSESVDADCQWVPPPPHRPHTHTQARAHTHNRTHNDVHEDRTHAETRTHAHGGLSHARTHANACTH